MIALRASSTIVGPNFWQKRKRQSRQLVYAFKLECQNKLSRRQRKTKNVSMIVGKKYSTKISLERANLMIFLTKVSESDNILNEFSLRWKYKNHESYSRCSSLHASVDFTFSKSMRSQLKPEMNNEKLYSVRYFRRFLQSFFHHIACTQEIGKKMVQKSNKQFNNSNCKDLRSP